VSRRAAPVVVVVAARVLGERSWCAHLRGRQFKWIAQLGRCVAARVGGGAGEGCHIQSLSIPSRPTRQSAMLRTLGRKAAGGALGGGAVLAQQPAAHARAPPPPAAAAAAVAHQVGIGSVS